MEEILFYFIFAKVLTKICEFWKGNTFFNVSA